MLLKPVARRPRNAKRRFCAITKLDFAELRMLGSKSGRSGDRTVPSTPLARRLHARALRERLDRQIQAEELRRKRAEEMRRRLRLGLLFLNDY